MIAMRKESEKISYAALLFQKAILWMNKRRLAR